MDNRKLEAKIITHLSEREVGEDVHIIKEVEYKNGKYEDTIKIVKNFKRPFWVTKDAYQNHTGKKEAEDLSKVDRFLSTESQLYRNISRRLGQRYINIHDPRRIKKSPYLYGSDVDSRTFLKYYYNKKYGDNMSPYRVGVFDIEVDILTNELIILSIVSSDTLKISLLKSYADRIPNLEQRLTEGLVKHIPEFKDKQKILNNTEIRIFNTEVEMIKWIFHNANYMNIDFLTGWNIKYDITEMLERIYDAGLDPADIFHYDKIPSQYKYFRFKEGRSKKITEAGREIPLPPEEQWHTVKASTNYYFIDAMNAHRYVRVGGATVPGGYSLDNILKKEGVVAKLRFDTNAAFKGAEWHINMVQTKPLEYIIYNVWDNMSILVMDDKTKDITVSVPLLSGISHFDIFNSGPRKLVDAIEFFYLSRGKVLGVKDMTETDDKILGLDKWVITLIAYMTEDMGLHAIEESNSILTNIRTHVSDLDVSSAYPNATRIANVSKDTTHREIIKIGKFTKEEFMIHNINIMYSKTNSLEYCQQMFKMPSLYDLANNLVS